MRQVKTVIIDGELYINVAEAYDVVKNQQKSLTVAEAADELNISISTIRRRIKEGDIKSFKIEPNIVRIPYSEILKFKG